MCSDRGYICYYLIILRSRRLIQHAGSSRLPDCPCMTAPTLSPMTKVAIRWLTPRPDRTAEDLSVQVSCLTCDQSDVSWASLSVYPRRGL